MRYKCLNVLYSLHSATLYMICVLINTFEIHCCNYGTAVKEKMPVTVA